MPLEPYRDQKQAALIPPDAQGRSVPKSAAWLLYTGSDRELAERLMQRSFYR